MEEIIEEVERAIGYCEIRGTSLRAIVYATLAARDFITARNFAGQSDEYCPLDSALARGRHEEEDGVDLGGPTRDEQD